MNKCVMWLLATVLAAGAAEPALQVSWLNHDVLCLRTSHLPDNFAEQLLAAQPTNKFSGTILDLRFADGSKTVPVGSLFPGPKPPLVILVNSQTRGAAAELATQLRSKGRAIVMGSANASGKIVPDITVAVNSEDERKFQENPFAAPMKPFISSPPTNNLLPFIDHMSEAELVRKHAKDGDLDEVDIPRAEPTQPVIRDPALARAVDLLKALAVLNLPRG